MVLNRRSKAPSQQLCPAYELPVGSEIYIYGKQLVKLSEDVIEIRPLVGTNRIEYWMAPFGLGVLDDDSSKKITWSAIGTTDD